MEPIDICVPINIFREKGKMGNTNVFTIKSNVFLSSACTGWLLGKSSETIANLDFMLKNIFFPCKDYKTLNLYLI